MNLSEICRKIKSLISAIFTSHKKLEEATERSHLRARDAVPLFIEAVKEIAPLRIKYSGASLGNVSGKQLIWHEEYGIGVKVSRANLQNQLEPLRISEGDFQVETLVQLVKDQLDSTLRQIESKKEQVIKRTERVEQLIATLKQWETGNL